MSEQIQLAGGINVRYRKSCGMCRHKINAGELYSIYCMKAFELDGNEGEKLYEARSKAPSRREFNMKYGVATNMVCDEYFEPVSTRFSLD